MPISFKRSVGALADVKELEYIIALHQTCMPDTRENATVSSLDVMNMLKSRHRLQITHEQAIQVVQVLGGGDPLVSPPKHKKHLTSMVGFHKTKSPAAREDGVDDGKMVDAVEEVEAQQKKKKDSFHKASGTAADVDDGDGSSKVGKRTHAVNTEDDAERIDLLENPREASSHDDDDVDEIEEGVGEEGDLPEVYLE